MLSYAVNAAKKADIFDVIHVSTDSDEVAQISEEYGSPVDFLRPNSLAGDHTPIINVLEYVVEEYARRGEEFSTIALVYATTPMLSPNDLKRASRQFEGSNRDVALLSVAPLPVPVERVFFMGEDGDLSFVNTKKFVNRSQDLERAYYDAAMFAFYTPDYIKAHATGGMGKFKGYIISPDRVVDIDWPEDWDRAEKMFKVIEGDRS